MCLGVAAQQLVELLLLGIDARVELGGHRRDRRIGGVGRQVRVFAGQFVLERVARLFGGDVGDLQARHLVGDGGGAREVVLGRDARNAEVADLEVLEPALGLGQLGLVTLDLVVDEAAGLRGVALLGLGAVAHEQVDQRAHHGLGRRRVGVAHADDVQVAAARIDLDAVDHAVDRLLVRDAAGGRVGVSGPENALDVGTRHQRAREHPDLLVGVGLERQAGHQRLEHGLRVDIDAGARLVAIRSGPDDRHAQHHGAPHHADREPTPPPDCPQGVQEFFCNLVHVRSPHPARTRITRIPRTSFAAR